MLRISGLLGDSARIYHWLPLVGPVHESRANTTGLNGRTPASVCRCGQDPEREESMTQNQEKIPTERVTDKTQGSEPVVRRGKERLTSERTNVSQSERLICGLLGGVCLFKSATCPLSRSGVLSAVLSVAFFYRALGGYGPAHSRSHTSQIDLLSRVGPCKYRAGVQE